MAIKPAVLARHVALLRIVFGCIWLIDAIFKWQPSFRDNFLSQFQSAAQGQPNWLHWWFSFWTVTIANNPHLFAILVAVLESLIALALLIGIARRTIYLTSVVFSVVIWSVAEGFGGPYSSASTDIGTAIIYAIVFLSLYGLERLASPPRWSVDNYIVRKLPWWSVISNP
jgi:nitrite reductase (NO-forming)